MPDEDLSYYEEHFYLLHKYNQNQICERCSDSLARVNKLKSLGFNLYPEFESTHFNQINEAGSIERVKQRLVIYQNSNGKNESFKSFRPMAINNFNSFEIKFIDASYYACEPSVSLKVYVLFYEYAI